MSNLRQIINALERARDALQAQADALCDAGDYSAEFPAADAERMREVIDLLEPVARGVPLDLKPDPLDTGLPCNVRIGHCGFGKGVPLRILVEHSKRLYRLAHGADADAVANESLESRKARGEAFLLRLRNRSPSLGGPF